MKCLFLVIAVLAAECSTFAGASPVAAARQATPANSPLAGLGLPEFTITATDQGYSAPAELAAGWYLVTFDNQTNDEWPSDLLLLPEGQTVESVTNLIATPQAGPPPAWIFETIWSG